MTFPYRAALAAFALVLAQPPEARAYSYNRSLYPAFGDICFAANHVVRPAELFSGNYTLVHYVGSVPAATDASPTKFAEMNFTFPKGVIPGTASNLTFLASFGAKAGGPLTITVQRTVHDQRGAAVTYSYPILDPMITAAPAEGSAARRLDVWIYVADTGGYIETRGGPSDLAPVKATPLFFGYGRVNPFDTGGAGHVAVELFSVAPTCGSGVYEPRDPRNSYADLVKGVSAGFAEKLNYPRKGDRPDLDQPIPASPTLELGAGATALQQAATSALFP